jgi:hypothetical protein
MPRSTPLRLQAPTARLTPPSARIPSPPLTERSGIALFAGLAVQRESQSCAEADACRASEED